MKKLFISLFSSKKFIAALIEVVLIVLTHFGINIPIEVALGLFSPISLYIVGQAIADHGKEKAKVENGK